MSSQTTPDRGLDDPAAGSTASTTATTLDVDPDTGLKHSDGGASLPPTDEDVRVREVQRLDDPAQIRDEIAATRSRMSGTIDALEDRVHPSRVADRNRAKVRSRWQSLRDNVMGSIDDLTPDDSGDGRDAGDVADDARQAVRNAPQRVKRRTRGNPMAAGMVAFGLGAIIGSALPETDAEQEAAERAAERVDTDRLRQEAQRVAQEVREPVEAQARQAAEEVRQTARSEAEDVHSDAQSSAERVRSHAEDEAQQVRDSAQDSAEQVRSDG